MFGAIEVQGDLVAVLAEVYRALRTRHTALALVAAALRERRGRLTRERSPSLRSRQCVLSTVAGSEAGLHVRLFPHTHGDTLEAAQIAKMERICRKLALRPGERVLEAGCGWGGLALYMARHYGVTVRAMNVSAEQIGYARERARLEQLDHRVEFVEDDYRDVRGSQA